MPRKDTQRLVPKMKPNNEMMMRTIVNDDMIMEGQHT